MRKVDYFQCSNCDECGSEKEIIEHEKHCGFNALNKGCLTCKHLKPCVGKGISKCNKNVTDLFMGWMKNCKKWRDKNE